MGVVYRQCWGVPLFREAKGYPPVKVNNVMEANKKPPRFKFSQAWWTSFHQWDCPPILMKHGVLLFRLPTVAGKTIDGAHFVLLLRLGRNLPTMLTCKHTLNTKLEHTL